MGSRGAGSPDVGDIVGPFVRNVILHANDFLNEDHRCLQSVYPFIQCE